MEDPVDHALGRSFQFGVHGEALLVVTVRATTSMNRLRPTALEFLFNRMIRVWTRPEAESAEHAMIRPHSSGEICTTWGSRLFSV